jgi:hypothetical protein
MHSPIAATALLEPIPRKPIHPQAAARFPAAFRALFRFPTRTVRKPQEVVILVTIEACLMVDTDAVRTCVTFTPMAEVSISQDSPANE